MEDYRVIWGQEGTKEAVTACPTSPLESHLEVLSQKKSNVGMWQQDSVIGKAGRLTLRHTIHHPSLPLVPK